jgi:hypothetical protein
MESSAGAKDAPCQSLALIAFGEQQRVKGKFGVGLLL